MTVNDPNQPTRQQILEEIGIFKQQIAPAVKWLKAEISSADRPTNQAYVTGIKQELCDIEQVAVEGENIIQRASDIALHDALTQILRDPTTGQPRRPQSVGWRIVLTKLVEQVRLSDA